MKTPWLPLLLVACLCSAGCRQDPYMSAVFESMNAEKRALEDRIYELQDEHEALDDQLESTRRENNKLRKQLGGGADEEDTSRPKRSSPAPRSLLPGRSNGSADPPEPKIDLGTPGELEPGPARPGPRNLEMNGPAPRGRGTPNELPAPVHEGAAASYEEPEDSRVTHIILNPFLTGGHDFDHKPGDDGVSVIIEPRNSEDQFVALPGPVSIVVIDPAQEGDAAKLARWDFSADEARERLKTSRIGRGIGLKLPWPNQAPEGNKIHIFVRYTTLDGRKLEADREVNIALPGQYSQRWTPRPAESPGARETGDGTSSVLVGKGETRAVAPATYTEGKKKSGTPETARRRPTWQPNR